MNVLYFILLLFIFCGCSHPQGKSYEFRDAMFFDVKDSVQEICIDSPLIGGWSRSYMMDSFLVICDHRSLDSQIKIFNKNDFSYIGGTGCMGEGPNEITTIGPLMIDEGHRRIYVSDYGKNTFYIFELDSIIVNSKYFPKEVIKMGATSFPDRFFYVNDSMAYVRSIVVNSGEHYQQSVAEWNIKTGDMSLLFPIHPSIERKRSAFVVSLEHDLIVDCYIHHDLLGLYSLDGKMKTFVYGPNWDDRTDNSMIYFQGAIICHDKILAAYSGGRNWTDEQYVNSFLVFDLEGNCLKKIHFGYKAVDFCYDEDNDRIFLVLEDEIQFAVLPLRGLL